MTHPNPATSQEPGDWMGQNYQYLMAAIAQVSAQMKSPTTGIPALPPLQHPATIEQLCQLFKLSSFERAIVLLCAGIELQPESAEPQAAPSFGLALSRLPYSHWSALTPRSPLRHWHLVELGNAPVLTQSPLRVNERILHFLLGDAHLDAQLRGIVTAIPTQTPIALPPSQQQLVTEIVALLRQAAEPPVVQLCGYDSATKKTIAVAVCAQLGSGLLNLAAEILPSDFNQLTLIQSLWERESLLERSLLLLDCEGIPDTTEGAGAPPQVSTIARVMETCQQPLLVFSRDRRSVRQRSVFNFDVAQPTTIEQRHLWLQSLAPVLEREITKAQVDRLVSHFSLSPLTIQTVCTQGLSHLAGSEPESLPELLWTACLSHARPDMEELAQPIRTQMDWDDLVLPDKEKQILQAIAVQVRQRTKVYEEWGFADKGQRGLGIGALFAGASGTGKTLAAEVLANELHLDLYRVDLSSVVSKYIGETEKNLRRIFDAAEVGGAILLFDEADALFGKRSEVKDSHDRHANMEVAYLLQRMESYRGLAILTTNLKNSLDQAFLRRLRFVVQFPFPDAAQRAEIWQRVFPKRTPTADLSYSKLSKLNVPGGNIRNIALNAAFLAAEANVPVQMHHILQTAQSEYIKLERPLTETEVKGWG
jgi:AAA+ superfamily predicted ATPase